MWLRLFYLADERSASMRYIANAYRARGEWKEAEHWLYKAMAEASYLREPYVAMAKLAYEQENWPKVYHMVEEALQITQRPLSYLSEPFAWDSTLYDLGALSCYELGMMEQSLAYAKKACEMSPNDTRLTSNLKMIQGKVGVC